MALNREIARRSRAKGIDVDEEIELRLGDCYVELPKLADESFDCCITDPPWGIDIEKSSTSRSREDYEQFKDTQDVYKRFLKEAVPQIFRILKDGSHFWLFFGSEFYTETRNALSDAGFDVRVVPCIWVKEKPNFSDVEYKPMPQYEMFFYSVKRQNKNLAPRRLNEATSDYFLYQRSPLDRIHRTEKPLDLIKRLISLSTAEGDRILDPFAGSASTLCAAVLLRRRALGFELEQDIHERADSRLQTMRVEEVAKEATEEGMEAAKERNKKIV
jgi:DNA modification methylase